MKTPIGLFGGTFNPVHHGHLRSALDICHALSLAHVTLIPNFISPHKQHETIAPTHRLTMLTLATQSCQQLKVSDIEINSPTVSFTVDTIIHFRNNYPDQPLCFLMGMDSFVNFTTWHRWQDILQHCHLVVSQRPGYQVEAQSDAHTLLTQHETKNINDLRVNLGGRIYLHQAFPLAISSSQMRQAISENQPITFLTPPAVEAYITTHQLYLAN
ncbi:nicotinate-nucleotide adenylyltransferase [Psychrobium sp. nBUS_13]|uniref:nicotinate-nucleotide adenylyltransferase n=1 Tax=Psychrobium sp. nBUS_13 TaxID=3395319 RepID=UPI003EBABCFB